MSSSSTTTTTSPPHSAFTPPDMTEMLPSERRAYLNSLLSNNNNNNPYSLDDTTHHHLNFYSLPRLSNTPLSLPSTFFNSTPFSLPYHSSLPRNNTLSSVPTNDYDVDFFSTTSTTSSSSSNQPLYSSSNTLSLVSPTPLSTTISSHPSASSIIEPTFPVTITIDQYSSTMPNCSLDKYVVNGIIGRGAFSKIQLGIHRTTRNRVAIKLIDYNTSATQARRMATIEANVYRLINNQCTSIVQCFDVLQTETTDISGLVLEYCPGGDLFDLLAYRHSDLNMREAARIAFQLCSAVAYLHDLGIVHRDLKLENILLVTRTSPFTIKLSDFGLAKILTDPNELISTRAGSEEYLAPEVIILTENPYPPKPADMWSVGVILYALLVGQLPFEQESQDVVVVEQVPIVPGEDPSFLKSFKPGFKRAAALLKHLETKFSFTTNHQPPLQPTPEFPCTPTTPSQETLVLDLQYKSTSPNAVTPTSPLVPTCTSPTSRPSSVCVTPVKVERRQSTRRAGRKALWHRIARAEFTFPDEIIMQDSLHTHGFPLLTKETKAIVRGLINVDPSSRLTARECCEDVPWIVAGCL